MKKFVIFLTLIPLLGCISAVHSSTGAVEGRVVEKTTHTPLPNTNVILVGTETGTFADEEGFFEIQGLEPGSYNLKFSRIGFRPIVKNRVVVKPGKTVYLEVGLEMQPIEMGEMKVTSTYFPEVKDAAVSARNMDFEEIITQPGGSWDVQRAVQALPSVVSAFDQNNEIIVRGGNFGENLFVIDNIEVPNPNHFAWQGTGGGPVTMINTDFVKEVDFIAGAFPARYGHKASSVLDIRMRRGARDGFHFKLDAGMAGYGGTLEGPAGDHGTYMFSGHKSFLSLIAESFGITAVPEYYNFQGKITADITPGHELSMLGIYGNDRIYFDEEAAAEDKNEFTIESNSHQYIMGVNLKSLFDGGYSMLTLSRTYNHWKQALEDTLTGDEWYHNISSETENTLKCDLLYRPSGWGEISLGAYLKGSGYDFDMWADIDTVFYYEGGAGDDDPDSMVYVHPEFRVREDRLSWKYGGYAQYRQEAGRYLTFNVGLRYDYFKYTGHDYYSPRAGLKLHLGRKTDLNVAYGRHYQAPEWYQLASDPANRTLPHKFTDQYVTGLDHLFSEDLKGSVEVYYKRYRDVPVERYLTTPELDFFDNVYMSEGEGAAKGIELFLHKKVKNNLWGTVSYSYSIARGKDPRYEDREFPWFFDHGHIFTSILGYRTEFRGTDWYESMKHEWWYYAGAWLPFLPGDQTEYSVKWRYLGGKPYAHRTYLPHEHRWVLLETDEITSERMKPYNRFDFHVERRWYYGSWSLLTYFDVNNLFNRKNILEYRYYEDGTTEEVYQFGRMIVGGAVVEF